MTDPRITKEMIEAAAMRMAQLELPDSHTLDDRLNAPWYRHTWQAEQVLEAVFALLPEPEWEYGGVTSNGGMMCFGLNREDAQAKVDAWNARADRLRRESDWRVHYPGANLVRRVPERRAGDWYPVPDTNEGETR